MSYEPLARVVRSGFVEGIHHGTAVALRADGSVALAAGSPDAPLFPRSALKPLQAVGMLRAGLDLEGPWLALASASHSGEPFHLDGVRGLLARWEIPVSALANTADLPLDPAEALAWRRADRPPSALAQNCSGKHAGMLATCVVAGWDTTGYLSPAHPLQRALRSGVEALTGDEVTATGVDGCGAPVFAVTLSGLARSFARLAVAAPATPEGCVAAAVRGHPEWLGGTGREVTELVRGVPGLIAKDGAESVWAAALPDGRALALKIADGGARAVAPVLVSLLRALGVTSPFLDGFGVRPLLGHGRPVGAVESLL